jgi:cytochrome c-type biogenesis protein CcmH
MQRYRTSFLAVVLAAVSLAQSSSQFQSEAVKRVGSKLACLCGGCNNTVADCQMLECHYSKPARERIAALQAAGRSDAQIVDVFVKDEGIRALAAPPAEGFNLLAWVMPFVAIAAGLAVIWLFIQRFRKPEPAGRAVAGAETLSRYQSRIDKDLTQLD